VLPYWIRGGCAAVLPGFDPETYLGDLARHQATEINLVPTMLGMLVTSGAAERADVSSLRTAFYGASPMPRPLLEQALSLWGHRLVQYYGQTEAPLVEEALLAHPAVTGAAVVGAPDDTWVEAVTAFVTLRPGASTSEDELRSAVRARLAGYKVPKTVHVIDAIRCPPSARCCAGRCASRYGTGRTSKRADPEPISDRASATPTTRP
jgi:acyl-CoA synthetase (AMP-forming)/AMP-acid ligase II